MNQFSQLSEGLKEHYKTGLSFYNASNPSNVSYINIDIIPEKVQLQINSDGSVGFCFRFLKHCCDCFIVSELKEWETTEVIRYVEWLKLHFEWLVNNDSECLDRLVNRWHNLEGLNNQPDDDLSTGFTKLVGPDQEIHCEENSWRGW